MIQLRVYFCEEEKQGTSWFWLNRTWYSELQVPLDYHVPGTMFILRVSEYSGALETGTTVVALRTTVCGELSTGALRTVKHTVYIHRSWSVSKWQSPTMDQRACGMWSFHPNLELGISLGLGPYLGVMILLSTEMVNANRIGSKRNEWGNTIKVGHQL